MLAPLEVSVVDPPVHIEVLVAVAVTIGNGLTVIVTVAVFVHPAAVVPVTV